MKKIWEMDSHQLYEAYSSTEKGISTSQAEKVSREKGKNMLIEEKQKSIFRVFIEQFYNLLVVILIIAAAISAISGNIESTAVIVAVLIINSILGTLQYVKAKKSLDSLKQLSSPRAKVIRDGQKQETDSRNIVPGDIVLLEAGDLVVADGRIIKNYSLQVNESSLTGESVNIDKTDAVLTGNIPLAERANMVFSGSLVTYGRADVLITSTGMETEIGKIARLMNQAESRKTPLQKSLDQFSAKLAVVIVFISIFVFCMYWYRGTEIIDALMFAVALAVAAIPEALGSIVTVVQAIGTGKMAKENAIVKDLKAVESLGCVSVICSDKTGTLTQNKMTVENIYIEGEVIKPEQINLERQLHRYLLYNAVLSNDSSIVDGKGIGDPTEYALLEMLKKINTANPLFQIDENIVRDVSGRIEEIPFDSERKMMSVKCKLHGKEHILTKGAVDVLLDRCESIRYGDTMKKLDTEERKKILRQNEIFSENGLRVLAFAYKETELPLTLEEENQLTFIGLVSMMDPPREESKEAIRQAKMAGIRTVMITGDHKLTAVAIAKRIGIYEKNDIAVTGQELDEMSEDELAQKITRISVYARVSPENKIRIVEAWQKKGYVTSMTGDGVNDAPALKRADIGVAMGITGTEVSKDAADMILSDDNFATIIRAVANGRNVFRNIKNVIIFLLSGNMAGIITVFYAAALGLPAPFMPVHLLFMNLLTDSLPAIAIGMEPSDSGLLQEKPRNPAEGILTKNVMLRIAGQGILLSAATLTAYYIGLKSGASLAATLAFGTLTLTRLFHGFNCRSSKPVFRIGLMSNKYSVGAFLAGVVLLALVFLLPFFHGIFEIAEVSVIDITLMALLGLAPTVVIQILKLYIRI